MVGIFYAKWGVSMYFEFVYVGYSTKQCVEFLDEIKDRFDVVTNVLWFGAGRDLDNRVHEIFAACFRVFSGDKLIWTVGNNGDQYD